MALFYLIRHGKPDYTSVDKRGFPAFGRDLAPLSEEAKQQISMMAKDERLQDASFIVSSPYTRALQTAAIISKETEIEIQVEVDLHEWLPDLSFRTLAYIEEMQPGEIIECIYEKGQDNCEYSFS